MSAVYWTGAAMDGDINNDANYFPPVTGHQPTSSDVFTYDNNTHAVVSDPSTDGGSARTWGGISILSGTWAGDSQQFSKIVVDAGASAAVTVDIELDGGDLVVSSVNGIVDFDSSLSFASLIVQNQVNGKTCIISGNEVAVISGSGVLKIASTYTGGTVVFSSFSGGITVDTITVDLGGASLSSDTISQLIFLNGGQLVSFSGPNNENVWCGYTNSTALTDSNWSQGFAPDGGSIYIDSRIKIGASTLASLNRLPTDGSGLSPSPSFNDMRIWDGGGKIYNYPFAFDGDIVNNNSHGFSFTDLAGGSIQGSGSQSDITITNLSATIQAPTIEGNFIVTGGVGEVVFFDSTVGSALVTGFHGTLVNNRTAPTGAGIVDLEGSTVTATLQPSASAFTGAASAGGAPGNSRLSLGLGIGL